ncbi:MAG: tRNA lysidine(34) synthetase TilS [Pelagibacteraceae bacterium]|nr:tRNA lysidine(34) synthetase TilS [Pelagibacteraceae bacterium]
MIKKNKIYKSIIKDYCKKNQIKKTDNIIISLSGGLDSTALFFLINFFFPKNKIHVLIFDHGVRKESKIEILNIVRLYNLNKHYPYKVFKIKNKIQKNNFQNKSREIRLNSIYAYAKKNNISNIFFGHHYNDFLETFLLRKIQSSGISGLTNVFSLRFKNFFLHRPLLNIPKLEILEFAKKNRLIWYEDQTNNMNIYTRNKIRNYLKKNINKKVLLNYQKNITKVQTLDEYLMNLISYNKKSLIIDKKIFTSLPLVLKNYLILKILSKINVSHKIRPENIKNIVAYSVKKNNFNRKISIKGGFIRISDFYMKFIPYNLL